ncbi:hypothetical protein MESS4_560018 [Mesorhizobium sp. STM 4661]|nr:hypothetical protein MESS4_560018 [Mesorhizobium sp. STM 4661]
MAIIPRSSTGAATGTRSESVARRAGRTHAVCATTAAIEAFTDTFTRSLNHDPEKWNPVFGKIMVKREDKLATKSAAPRWRRWWTTSRLKSLSWSNLAMSANIARSAAPRRRPSV